MRHELVVADEDREVCVTAGLERPDLALCPIRGVQRLHSRYFWLEGALVGLGAEFT